MKTDAKPNDYFKPQKFGNNYFTWSIVGYGTPVLVVLALCFAELFFPEGAFATFFRGRWSPVVIGSLAFIVLTWNENPNQYPTEEDERGDL